MTLLPSGGASRAHAITLQRCTISTPKEMCFKLDTVRYTKKEWGESQRCAAEIIACCAEQRQTRIATAAAVRGAALVEARATRSQLHMTLQRS